MLFDLYVVFIFILYYGLLVNTITILSIFNYLHKQCVKYRYHNYGKVDHCCRYKKRICTEINFSFFLIPSLLHTKTCGFYKSRRFFPCFFKLSKLFFNFHMLSVHTLSAPDSHTLYDPSAHLHLPGYPAEAQSCLFQK